MYKSSADNHFVNILKFRVMDTHACIDVKNIIKVIPLMRVEPIPLAENYIAGLLNYAGQSIQLIDLGLLFHMQRKSLYSIDTPVLLCISNNNKLAMIVDSIQGLSTYNTRELQSLHDTHEKNIPILGAINLENTLSLLIDMEKIYAELEL